VGSDQSHRKLADRTVDWFLALLQKSKGLDPMVRYSLAAISVLVVATVRVFINRAIDGDVIEYPFVLFYLSTLLATLLLGSGPGLLAGSLSTLFVVTFFMLPVGSVTTIADPVNTVELSSFVVYTLALTSMVAAIDRVMGRLRDSEGLRELLFKEFRHRSRNDLNSLYALLTLRAKNSSSSEAKHHLTAAAQHTMTLAWVYKRLEQHQYVSGDVTIDTREFIEGLVSDIAGAMGVANPRVKFKADAWSCRIDFERAIALGLILNEAITNSIKYAFPDYLAGTINVSFSKHDSKYVLKVSDDGVGLQVDNGTNGNGIAGSGLGTKLLKGLSSQLRGSLIRVSGVNNTGTIVMVTFPAR
jgi:two-component sensor histidine kinase